MQIYLTPWSVRQTMVRRGLTLPDLPEFVSAEGYHGLELTDREITRSGLSMPALRGLLEQHACGLIIDINCDLTLQESTRRTAEIEHLISWLLRAAELNVDRVRITLGGQMLSIQKLLARRGEKKKAPVPGQGAGPFKSLVSSYPLRVLSHRLRTLLPVFRGNVQSKLVRATEALCVVIPKAEDLGVRMGIENHWGVSSRPEWILKVVEKLDSPYLGTCPDFGNFPRSVDPYRALEVLIPFATHLQAKSWKFDDRGEETALDYSRCMALARGNGYEGPITIEYEGNGDDLQDCGRTRALIERYRA